MLRSSGLHGSRADFRLRQIRAGADGDALLLAGIQISGGYIDDSIGINIKGYLNLRNSRRRTLDSSQTEIAEQCIVLAN